jgi:hypothetical protein
MLCCQARDARATDVELRWNYTYSNAQLIAVKDREVGRPVEN